ncbi:hypothetical protein MJG53_009840 [Ovis ammon polii x Ovis aries]|uniref:Uncharacterized protein n=2 Tax=Ovis TaxID=9935 RepID=A0A836AAA7_SHEEP|nr:hypothetical protein JEQ12_002096 [Ovis aries]KAI4581397.1 hypothetical protein MJG53_009840 [Ovis ammon polii x Ovis aries]
MLEGRGDNFDGVNTDRLKLELPEERHLRFFDWFGLVEKQLLELKEKKYQVSLYGRVRYNSENQKTMNAMRGPVKKISRSSRLSKLNL